MLNWKEYTGHRVDIKGKRKKYDNTIYTFDIETSSYLILNGKTIPAYKYDELSKKDQEDVIFMSNMYIWMFGINDQVYYGRTWNELKAFMLRIENWATDYKKYVYVHNLAYEFQYLREPFKMKNVFARKSRKVIKFEIEDFNFEFRCTYMMTNVKLEQLPKIYQLPVKKLVGNLDYKKIRNSKTILSDEELNYCENDCLVIYYYIQKELEKYETLKNIPLTSTGHVRRELHELIDNDYSYRNKVRKSVNTDGHIYNLLLDAFAGGYTHSNWIHTDEIIKNVKSFDFTSSYPYVMVTCKFPSTEFKKCRIKTYNQLLDCFAYILVVKFKNIKSKYYNNFISQSKCKSILKGKYDNGRVIAAEELEIVLTDVDFKFLYNSYEFESYEFEEVYYSIYDYLPKQFIEFILEKYIKKTEYKGVEGKEVEYALEKAMFNSLYGMSVTNNIKDNVIFDNITGWSEVPLENEVILEMLQKEKKQGFLSFSYGVWVTAWARYNLLTNLIKLDKYVVYADTDSLKLAGDYDINIINNYNEQIKQKIKKVSEDLKIDINKFAPVDKKGKRHLLGVFDNDGSYDEFITQGAKKYAYIDSEDKQIHITVSGVPKSGAKALKSLEDFKDNFIFKAQDTNKNMLIYNDDQEDYNLVDYQGNEEIIKQKCGCCLVPNTYTLGKSEEYCHLLSDDSSKRSIYKEG